MLKALIAKINNSKFANDDKQIDLSIVATTLLLEVVKADHQQTETELKALREHCALAFSLSEDEVEILLSKAVELSNSATSLWEHTDLINKQMNNDAKYQLIVAMWKIAYSDNNLDRYEDHLIRRVSDLIYLPHTLFIKAKHEVIKIAQ